MPRFVILEHDHPQLHWDLLLECGPVLRAWRLLAAPQPGRTVPAQPSFDHRPFYLDYEGPVGGGRGQVKRWDGGSFRWLTPAAGEAGRVEVLLAGQRLQGPARLERAATGDWSFSAP
jgi:hypothetical protein